MKRLSSCAELRQLRDLLLANRDPDALRVVICNGTACQASGSMDIVRAAQGHLVRNGLAGKVSLRTTGCHGFCEMGLGPYLAIEPLQVFYAQLKTQDVPRVIQAALDGQCIEDLLYRDPKTGQVYRSRDEVPFFKNQFRRLLDVNPKIDPTRIQDYIAQGGYAALADVLWSMKPEAVVDEVKQAGLRGRGGGGFPTGRKWEMLAKQPGPRGKILICNADEGDPGAFMDRCLLEGNPHSIVEGMAIGAYGTGANEGIVYVRDEYPMAVENLTIALNQARDCGLLGQNILGTGFSFDIRMVRGAGAFVCGEETALIRSVEGRMGEPRQRPPYPVQKGVDGKPTVINNVETWANIPVIIRQGASEFAKVGTKTSTGTKIFSLVGKIKNTGLVEVPMGITVGQIVHDIGGGPSGNAKIKAVQTGGPSGGCIPADKFDLTVDYDSLAAAGSIMGSGGMIVMDENTCMVDVAKYFMNFLKDESCGKCFTCRKGTQRMYELLDDITNGRGTLEHLDLLEELALAVKDTTMCGLGQTAANPVLSTLRYYRHEYLRHVVDKRCDAFVCSNLVGASCQAACPVDTEAWRYVALLEKGRYDEAYRVIREANPFPSICARVCDRKCEQHCQLGTSGGEPLAVRSLKRFITDRVDPAVYRPAPTQNANGNGAKVAVIGGGPAGISAAHCLSLLGHQVTLFEAQKTLGGMLVGGIPAYRLPRDLVAKEIASLLNDNITVRMGTALGTDVTLDGLLKDGFRAVFLAIGADVSSPLGLPGEDLQGVYPSMQFLKDFNLRGTELGKGRVGVIGGGNSAVDAARVAFRQKDVKDVCILYRRTEREMPAYLEELEAARDEGIELQTLVSPVRIVATNGRVSGVECIRNQLGAVEAGGRRRPVPIPGSEFVVPLDTLVVATGERPDDRCIATAGLELDRNGRLKVDPKTFRTSRDGVFAGGDVTTGPATVVNAIATGKKAAAVIDRYLRGESLSVAPEVKLPRAFIEPAVVSDEERDAAERAEQAHIPLAARQKSFAEVELGLTEEQARTEARRCLRCDLKFTQEEEKCGACQTAAAAGS